MVDRKMAKNIHILIRGICKYVTLHDENGFADVTKAVALKKGDHAGLSG